jgi:hypothetical protein
MARTKKIPVRSDPLAQVANLPTKSAKIRALHAAGMSRGQIAKALNIRYQHVRNVLVTPVKKTS